MPKYDELTNRLGRFLLGDKRTNRPRLIDPFEASKMNQQGKPIPLNIKWQLEDRRRGMPKALTKTHIAEHLRHNAADRSTYFYRSSRGQKHDTAGHALLKLDIDAHDGATDALSVADTIQHFYFPDCYHEPSTGGRGRHVYLVLAFQKYTPRRAVNRHLQRFGIALRELLKSQGYQARLDVLPLRTFSEWREIDGKLVAERMGQPAKLPRPRNLDDMARLESAPIVTPRDLENVVEDWKRVRAATSSKPETSATSPLDVEDVHREPRQTSPQPRGGFRGVKMDDPRSRSVHAVMSLARSLGRLPMLDEARSFYLSSGLATIRPSGDRSQDVARRDRRLIGAIEFVGRTFDSSKAGNGIELAALLPLIMTYVTPDHRKGTKYAYGISDKDLAITLHVIERASFDRAEIRDHQWGCPNSRIVETFRKLKRDGDRGEEAADNNTSVSAPQKARGCNRNKAVAMKIILVRAGLAEVIDESYRVGTRKMRGAGVAAHNNTSVSALTNPTIGTAWEDVGDIVGRGKRIVVGIHHPRRQEWNRDYERLAAWVFGWPTAPVTIQHPQEAA